MNWTGRVWPSLAQNDCACALRSGANHAVAVIKHIKTKGETGDIKYFIGTFYNEGCSQKSFRHPPFYKILIQSSWPR
jgi:hypothetical protein